MHDLQLVGFTTDRRGLIFRTAAGARGDSYVVPLTDELLAVVAELSAHPAEDGDEVVEATRVVADVVAEVVPDERPRSMLSVRDIQARLRAGESTAQVASEAGVDDEWIERFAPPVRAEQRRVVEQALECHLERARSGESAVPLRRAVGMAMADKGIAFTIPAFDAAWSSHLIGHDRWAVTFTYRHRGRDHTATWVYDAETGELTTSDRIAAQLGYVPSSAKVRDDAGVAIDGIVGDPSATTQIGVAEPAPRPRRRRAAASTTEASAAPAAEGSSRGSSGRSGTRAGKAKAAGARAKKAATKRSSAKKAATKRSSAKKATAKKATAKKATSKKATASRRTTAATKTAAQKKAASKKAATKKRAAPKKKTPKKAAPRKAAPKKRAAPKKSAPKRAAAPKKAAPKRAATKAAATARTTTTRTGVPSTAGATPTASSAAARPAPAPARPSATRPAPARAVRPPAPAPAAPPVEPRPAPVEPRPAPVEPRPAPVGDDERMRIRSRRAPDRPVRTDRPIPDVRDVAHRPGEVDLAEVPLAPAPPRPAEPPSGNGRPPGGGRPPELERVPDARDAVDATAADRADARRARAAERNAPTVQFRSGSAVPVRRADANGAGRVPSRRRQLRAR